MGNAIGYTGEVRAPTPEQRRLAALAAASVAEDADDLRDLLGVLGLYK